MDFTSLRKCCATPNLKIQPFRQSCGKYMKMKGTVMPPCLFECILNSSEALNGTQLNVDNARRLIEKLVGNYKDFVDVYTQALQTCTANETDLLKFKRRRFLGSETCSALPLYLASCVLKKSFINCPSANWTHSEKCENAREFSMNCNRFSGGVLVADFVL
ncbi:uncharacterized protein LOC116805027 [Drosophila grimshawi]|uniref:uncharacterized protein LOC116805027 n=1 Tax=Drosophila grimshawi TaxID=7222 RepID=UPI000C86FC60|nr:uncharacterized protein LOC116805027 [Drosophila grimshawi]